MAVLIVFVLVAQSGCSAAQPAGGAKPSADSPVLDSKWITLYFSPHGGAERAAVEAIDAAHETLDIAMYYFTSSEAAWAVVRAQERGVKVRVYMDKSQRTQKYSKSRFLEKRKVPVRYHTGSGLMHNKFAVIDGKVVVTGSFNWTASAEEKNEENLLIIRDADVAKAYAVKFEAYWHSAAGED